MVKVCSTQRYHYGIFDFSSCFHLFAKSTLSQAVCLDYCRGCRCRQKISWEERHFTEPWSCLVACLMSWDAMSNWGVVWVWDENYACSEESLFQIFDLCWDASNPPSALGSLQYLGSLLPGQLPLVISCPVPLTPQEPAQDPVRFICSNCHGWLSSHFYGAIA